MHLPQNFQRLDLPEQPLMQKDIEIQHQKTQLQLRSCRSQGTSKSCCQSLAHTTNRSLVHGLWCTTMALPLWPGVYAHAVSDPEVLLSRGDISGEHCPGCMEGLRHN